MMNIHSSTFLASSLCPSSVLLGQYLHPASPPFLSLLPVLSTPNRFFGTLICFFFFHFCFFIVVYFSSLFLTKNISIISGLFQWANPSNLGVTPPPLSNLGGPQSHRPPLKQGSHSPSMVPPPLPLPPYFHPPGFTRNYINVELG